MSQVWEIGDINPTTTSPLTDISRLTRSMDALHSLFSGPSSPQVTVPYMFWADTTEGILKRRNAENSSWVFALSLTESFIKNINVNYIMVTADNGNMLLVDADAASIIIHLVAASSARAGAVISIKKIDNTINTVTLSTNATETIDGDTNYILQITNEAIILRSDGSNWRVVNLYRPRVVLPKTGEYIVTKADDRAIISILIATSIVRLPLITDIHNGFTVTIKKVAAGVTTIDPRAVAIDGVIALKTLTAVNQAITLVSNGTSWLILNEANVPITQNFATLAEMKAQIDAQISVNPFGLYYSPVSVQVVTRFNTSGTIIAYVRGCTVIAITGTGRVRINFTNPYATIVSYAATGTTSSGSGLSLSFIVLQNHTTSYVECQTYGMSKPIFGPGLDFFPADNTNVSVMACGQLI